MHCPGSAPAVMALTPASPCRAQLIPASLMPVGRALAIHEQPWSLAADGSKACTRRVGLAERIAWRGDS